jgi:hypothetical protein
MNERDHKGQKGVILLQVLMQLALFGIVGLTFTFYASDSMCERNGTVEVTGDSCTKTIGNTADRRP